MLLDLNTIDCDREDLEAPTSASCHSNEVNTKEQSGGLVDTALQRVEGSGGVLDAVPILEQSTEGNISDAASQTRAKSESAVQTTSTYCPNARHNGSQRKDSNTECKDRSSKCKDNTLKFKVSGSKNNFNFANITKQDVTNVLTKDVSNISNQGATNVFNKHTKTVFNQGGTNSFTKDVTNVCQRRRPNCILGTMTPQCVYIVCVFLTSLQCGFASVIRNPADLDHLIDLDHKYLTYSSFHNNDDVIDTMQYYFRSRGTGAFAPLKHNPSIDLSSPVCFVENGEIVCHTSNHKKVHFYTGDNHKVAVSVTNDNGTMKVNGLVNDGTTVYEISPAELTGQATDQPHARHHVIKKRWTATMIRSTDKRKKTSRYGGAYKTNRKQQKKYSRYPSYPQYPKKQNRKRKYKDIPDVTSASDYCINLLCVVDYSIYKKFKVSEKSDSAAMEKIKYYYAHIVNGINMRFQTISSKDFDIKVRLAGYFIAKSPSDLAFIDSKKMASDPSYRVNSNYTLTNLHAYLTRQQSRRSPRASKNVLPDFNHAMLFLEYAATNLGGTVLGTSFVGGICSDSKSTSLVVDHGAYTAAGIGTHELGHNLGVFYHDGEGTARSRMCNASHNYIMAPASYLIDDKNLQYSFSFSQCSLMQIKKHLNTLIEMNRNCLKCSRTVEKIDKQVELHLATLPGLVEDVHAQCRQLYGPNSFMCPPKSPEEMCYRMYCYDADRSACAIISEQMAATGTPCGKYKICNMGRCVRDKQGQNVPDDCPYPDIPTYSAHCEDATPYMCKNEKFKQKCCASCNKAKDFTAEESCKDSHIPINDMSCTQLMNSIFGEPGCMSDNTVQNLCCQSCKSLLGGSRHDNGLQSHLGGGSGGRLYSTRPVPRTRPPRPPYTPVRGMKKSNKRIPSSCMDSTQITFNGMECPVIVANNALYCSNSKIRTTCCRSCYQYSENPYT